MNFNVQKTTERWKNEENNFRVNSMHSTEDLHHQFVRLRLWWAGWRENESFPITNYTKLSSVCLFVCSRRRHETFMSYSGYPHFHFLFVFIFVTFSAVSPADKATLNLMTLKCFAGCSESEWESGFSCCWFVFCQHLSRGSLNALTRLRLVLNFLQQRRRESNKKDLWKDFNARI